MSAKAPAKKRGLGRGLEALLGPKAAADAPALEASPDDNLRALPVDAIAPGKYQPRKQWDRSEEHTSELQSTMRPSYTVFCLKNKNTLKKPSRHNTILKTR